MQTEQPREVIDDTLMRLKIGGVEDLYYVSWGVQKKGESRYYNETDWIGDTSESHLCASVNTTSAPELDQEPELMIISVSPASNPTLDLTLSAEDEAETLKRLTALVVSKYSLDDVNLYDSWEIDV